jgi:hypothetical protein
MPAINQLKKRKSKLQRLGKGLELYPHTEFFLNGIYLNV